jgi:hypothetical protein
MEPIYPKLGQMDGTEPTYETFLSRLFRPDIKSLKEPGFVFDIQVPAGIVLAITTLYPFHTVNDLLTQIYIQTERKEEYHPDNVCLMREDSITKELLHIQYTVGRGLGLADPLTRMQKGPDSRFATMQGEPTDIPFVPQGDVLLESAFKKSAAAEPIKLRLFLYRDVLAAAQGPRPLSSAVWNGCIRPYFPTRSREHEDGSLPADALAFAPTRVKTFTERLAILDRMEESVGEPLRKPGNTTRGDPVKFSSVKYIRFNWDAAPLSHEAFDLESFFFDLSVSPIIPYVRLFSKKASTLSKVHVRGLIPEPSIEPASLLEGWAKTKSPRPEGDALVAKVRMGTQGTNATFYMTWYIYEDGSSQLTVQPPEGVRSLTRQDMDGLAASLRFIESAAPKLSPKRSRSAEPLSLFSPRRIQLQDAYMVLALWLEKDDPNPLTRSSLRTLLPYFKVFFQDTSSPIKEQNPLVYLRYKAVNNFVTPARDMTFLRRILELRRIQGAGSLAELVQYYKEEFDVPESVARNRVLAFQSKLAEVIEIQSDASVQREFTQTENPGIDIAAFGKFPYYTFHLYRVDSVQSLERIVTALSLFSTLTPESFEGLSTKRLEEQEEVDEATAEEGAAEEAAAEEPAASAAPAAAAATATPQQPQAALDELGDDFLGFGDGEEEEKPKSPPLAQVVREDSGAAAAPAAPPLPGKSKAKALAEDEEVLEAEDLKSQPARTYFLERLKFHDRRLFTYTKNHPSLKKYASMCAGNALKQPAVVSDAEFERMKDIYEDDVEKGRLVWIEYPLRGAAPSVPGGAESITTLRYGTSLLPGQANVYLCSRYWCRQDEIVVLTADFKATQDRKGRPKPANTCPFCRGGLVVNREQTVKGESVIERTVKDKSDEKRHIFVRFLKSSPHPEGFSLPCCFIKDQPIFPTHPAFAGQAVAAPTSPPSEEAEAPEPLVAEVSARVETLSAPSVANYRDAFARLHKDAYILASNKLPLEIEGRRPQIGLVPPQVERYFHQTKEQLVEKHGTMMNLKEGARGFLRIGVENRTRFQADAFLAAIAPYYGQNTAQDMKQEILKHTTPNVFVALGYGNFLFDFYDPNDSAPTSNELMRFVFKQFATEHGTGPQREALIRAYKAYQRFTAELQSPASFKEYRQYAHLLSLPNQLLWKDPDGSTLHANGIVFVVLEVNATSGSLEIRCPPYGITEKQAREADLAFILHYESGVWEPLFYTYNRVATADFPETHEITMVFSREAYAGWPSTVKAAAAEFERICKRDGLGLYTEVPEIESSALLPLGRAALLSTAGPAGIVRDSFNHVSGLAFTAASGLVIVPVVDDGTVLPELVTYLDWRNLRARLASEADVEEFYVKYVDPAAARTGKQGYARAGRVRLDKTGIVRDFTTALLRLRGGTFVPLRIPTATAKAEGEVLESEQPIDFLPWMDDMKQMFAAAAAPAQPQQLSSRDFEEIYQHLRLTFATWFSVAASATLRQEVNSILFAAGRPRQDISVMEKRQRLFILLGNEIISWMDSTAPLRARPQTLKRVNCILQPKEACTGACVWKDDSAKCLLHTPRLAPVEGQEVDAQRFMLRRLLEELIRFPMKREELLKAKVPTRIPLHSSFRSGDQYIVRETMPAWSEFLRMEWANRRLEVPRYPEEVLAASASASAGPAGAAAEPEPEPAPEPTTPALVTQWLGAQTADFIYHPLTTINDVFDVPAETFEGLLNPAGDFVSQAALTEFGKMFHYSLAQVELKPEGYTILVARCADKLTKKSMPFYVFVRSPEGLGVLSTSEDVEPLPFTSLPETLKKKVTLTRVTVI